MTDPVHISEVLPEAMERIVARSPFRKVTARHQSLGSCGHLILRDDVIGWDKETRRTRCAVCFKNIRIREGAARQRAMNERLEAAEA